MPNEQKSGIWDANSIEFAILNLYNKDHAEKLMAELDDLRSLRANQVVWKFPPFAPEDLPKDGEIVMVYYHSEWKYFAGGEAQLLANHNWLVKVDFAWIPIEPESVLAFCVIPKPPTKTGEGYDQMLQP